MVKKREKYGRKKGFLRNNRKREWKIRWQIVEIVAEQFGVTPAEIVSSKKSRNIAFPRQVSMYLCRKLTDVSLNDIGKKLGNRDHTTVLHGINKIENDMEKDNTLENTIGVLSKKISPQ